MAEPDSFVASSKGGSGHFLGLFHRQACSWGHSSWELFLSWLLVQHSPIKRSNSIAVLARLTLSWPQSAVTVTLWLLALLIARDKLSHQTRGDSNSLSCSSVFRPLALLLCLSALSPVSGLDGGLVGAVASVSNSLIWIYSCLCLLPRLVPSFQKPPSSSFLSWFFFILLILGFYPQMFTVNIHLPPTPAPLLSTHPSLSSLSCLSELPCFMSDFLFHHRISQASL